MHNLSQLLCERRYTKCKDCNKNGKFQEAKYGTKLCEFKPIVFRAVISELEHFSIQSDVRLFGSVILQVFCTSSYDITFYRQRYRRQTPGVEM
jgi:hypothetical protein